MFTQNVVRYTAVLLLFTVIAGIVFAVSIVPTQAQNWPQFTPTPSSKAYFSGSYDAINYEVCVKPQDYGRSIRVLMSRGANGSNPPRVWRTAAPSLNSMQIGQVWGAGVSVYENGVERPDLHFVTNMVRFSSGCVRWLNLDGAGAALRTTYQLKASLDFDPLLSWPARDCYANKGTYHIALCDLLTRP